MKKREFLLLLIIAFAVIMMLTSCNKYVVQNVFQKTYPESKVEIMYNEMAGQLKQYEFYVPLDKWILNHMSVDTITIDQRTARKIIDNRTEYTFIFIEYTYPTTSFYDFVIRYSGKKK